MRVASGDIDMAKARQKADGIKIMQIAVSDGKDNDVLAIGIGSDERIYAWSKKDGVWIEHWK